MGIRSTSFDPRSKTEPVHGVESAGLGTSTFLEGAPAPKSAIEKANAAAIMEDYDDGALARKKSLVQKIKSGRRGTSGAGDRSPPPPLNASLLTSKGTTATNIDPAYNPVFKERQFIERVESLPAPSPRERADSGGSDRGGPSGLLGRVKSLKISSGRSKPRKSDE